MKKLSIRLALVLAGLPALASAQPLQTIPVRERTIAQRVHFDGVVEAARQSTLSAQIAGQVKAIYFDVGDRVDKGAVILRIDEREAEQAVAGSRAELAQAEVSLDHAQANYERAKQLFAQQFISQAALDKAKAEFDMAKARVQAGAARVKQSALTQSYTAVVAPYSGVVAARLVELGEKVAVGTPLMTVFDPSRLRVIVNVPQSKLAAIGSQPEVSIEVPALQRWLKPASVTVHPVADSRTHTTLVRINLAANEKAIYPGMFVRAHFVVGTERKLTIPQGAVVKRSEVVAVYVVGQDGRPRLRQVRLGETTADGEVEVLSGLQAGERIALDPVRAGMVVQR